MSELSPEPQIITTLCRPRDAAFTVNDCETAVIEPGREWSYRQLDEYIYKLSDWLRRQGVTRGVRVGLMGKDIFSLMSLIMAVLRAGGTAAPLHFRLPELRIREISEDLGLTMIINTDETPLSESLSPGASPPSEWNREEASPEDEAIIIHTSGSTGAGKGVALSLSALYYSALGSNLNISVNPGDRWLLSLPLYHVGGLGILFRTFLGGGAVFIPSPGTNTAETILSGQITHASLVSAQLHQLLSIPGQTAPPRLKALLLGGGPLPEGLIREAFKRRFPLFTSYGSSETASQLCATSPNAPLQQLFTAGKPLKYREIRIAPNGEILARGKTLMKGYIRNGAVIPGIHPSGWLHTGDVGWIDSEGCLHVTGRIDNMFISGGENIYPEEIEQAILSIRGVSRALVIPVPHHIYGQRPTAFIRRDKHPENNHSSSENFTELLRALENSLPRFKIPDIFYDWPDSCEAETLKPNRTFFKSLVQNHSKLKILFQRSPLEGTQHWEKTTMPGRIFKYDTTIRLYMTDAAGYLFFAEQFRLVQDALEAFLESRGMSIQYFLTDASYSMPVVHASTNFKSPLRAGDRVTIQLHVKEIGESAITLEHTVYKNGNFFTGGGETVHVSISKKTGETIPLPTELVEKIRS